MTRHSRQATRRQIKQAEQALDENVLEVINNGIELQRLIQRDAKAREAALDELLHFVAGRARDTSLTLREFDALVASCTPAERARVIELSALANPDIPVQHDPERTT